MTRLHVGFVWAPFAAAATLAGCGVLRQAQDDMPPSVGVPGTALGDAALTMPHFVRGNVHPDHGSSWMDPAYGINGARRKSRLLYVGDDSTNDEYVYDYNSGKQVGALTGFDGPYGGCVDAKGDIYVANFDGGNVVEFAHGGTTVLNTYNSGGEPIGCSVDARGDVAATSFSPGEVTVFARGNPSNAKTYNDPDCELLSTMGYDDKGNLIGEGENTSIDVCALLAGAKSMTTLTTKGIFTDFPSGTMWDGKYFVLVDQEATGMFGGWLIQARLRDTTLTEVGRTVLSDDCHSGYVDIADPFVVGKKNTPVNNRQGTVVLGPNLWCADDGARVDYWHYPAGGFPFKRLPSVPADPYGAAVSIGT
jgi:hypothetical protein